MATNQHGLDVSYFTEKMGILIRDMDNYTNDELNQELDNMKSAIPKKKSIIEDAMTNAAKDNGLILIVKAETLPSGAMCKAVDLRGQVLIASVIDNNTEMIQQQLIDLNMIDEFDDSKSGKIIELAVDLLAHNGILEVQ